MVISSLIVEALPSKVESVASSLRQVEGVEVHGVEGTAGKIVITIEAESTDESHAIASSFVQYDGVMGVSLVYVNFEDEVSEAKAKAAEPVEGE